MNVLLPINLSDAEIQILGAVIVLLCVPALLRTEVKGKTAWVLYYPLLPIAAYIIYELVQFKTQSAEGHFRVDLLLIWPFLAWTLSKTCFRWMQASKATEPPLTSASELAVTGFVTGIVGFLAPFFLVFSATAVFCGHKAMQDPTEFRGKKLAGLGFAAGICGLVFGIISIMAFLSSKTQ
jgi:hypothetical protein